MRTLEVELQTFTSFFENLCEPSWVQRRLDDFVYELAPKNGASNAIARRHALTVMGLVHGNEVAGAAVLNDVLRFLIGNPSQLDLTVVFALGNPPAARANRRFIGRDLNRSFARSGSSTWEEQRAKVLEEVLLNSAYFLDLHQTTEPCETPFFIFPYTPLSYEFARASDPKLPIVTHWGKPFSTEGRCSDEFILAGGGVGITIELGQNSLNPHHISAGVLSVLQALQYVRAKAYGKVMPTPHIPPELYTWAKIYPWPEDGDVRLDEGWYNFKSVVKGQRLGIANGVEIFAECDGRVLFPKYLRSAEPPLPTELIRIMRKIDVKDLGT